MSFVKHAAVCVTKTSQLMQVRELIVVWVSYRTH